MDRSQVSATPEEPQGFGGSFDKSFVADNNQENSVCATTDPKGNPTVNSPTKYGVGRRSDRGAPGPAGWLFPQSILNVTQ